ncbi:MAG: heavy metal translocating P-type ATPase metal-binding domain-containing protein [Bacteroidetes bacterium]|nr:heavy metal translocating P-type ATPase metal-binding domain-containing protein [Bacteroidota bacterium]
MEKTPASTDKLSLCYHCGDTLRGERVEHDGKLFCCSGCKVVFEILQQNDLCTYYDLEKNPGRTPSALEANRFSFLDDATIQQQLVQFSDGHTATVTLSLPAVHCSSCIWLLEQLYKLDAGILNSRVDFLKKTVSITYRQDRTSLKSIVILLTSVGYEPELSLDALNKPKESEITRSLYYKIGVAGFCFGNSMLFSFPEYLGVDASEQLLREVFSYLNLLLGIPVATYCSLEYYRSAWGGLRKRVINIDLPIAIGIVLLFGRSAADILTGSGAGFIDSLCGLLFFLLLGRVFQSKTYDRMNFERSYTSYFPIAVTTKRGGVETTVPLSALSRGQRIVVRSNEIVPADAMLLQGNAFIDYSFVTGEAAPVPKVLGEMIYAGGRQTGGAIELEVMKEVSQSYLTQLWNNFRHSARELGQLSELSTTVSKYFTTVVLAVSLGVLAYWLPKDTVTAINAFTGILIVACPCALAIAIPFTLGTTLRVFGRNDFYLKNTAVIELLSKIDTIVFDKTGTITYAKRSSVSFTGTELTSDQRDAVFSIVSGSVHPVSQMIAEHLQGTKSIVDGFTETVGQGITGTVGGRTYRIGAREYVGALAPATPVNETRSYVSEDGRQLGYFSVKNLYRDGLPAMIAELGAGRKLAVVSGDNESERPRLQSMFPQGTDLLFNQTPTDKLEYVRSQQQQGKRVLMVGDGLNDAGALLQSNLGIAVTEDVVHFSPASDAIISSTAFIRLAEFLRFSRLSMRIVIASFVMAFLYNLVGIYFALQGMLTPIMAAILMPASSITIVVFTTVTTNILARRKGLLAWRS